MDGEQETVNEEQRKSVSLTGSEQANQIEKPLHEKTTADFAKYFQTTYQPPNLKQAKKRRREEVKFHYDFTIPRS